MAKIIRKSGASVEEWPLGQVSLSIGRRTDNHIVLPDTFASGRHAMIGYVNGRYFVEDLKSSNGTILNGQRISRAPLKNGDVIYIGSQRLEFQDETATVPIAESDPMATSIMTMPLSPPLAMGSGSGSGSAAPAAARAPAPAVTPAPPPPPPAPPPVPLPASPLPGFNFILPDLDAPKPAVQASASADADPLEGMARSIRSHRDREQQDRLEAEGKLKGEWERILQYAEKLQTKVKDDPRVRYFNISRRSGEVSIRVQPDPKLPQQTVLLAQEHPDHKTGTITGVWLRITGLPDRCHPTSDAAIAELARAIAFLFV